MKFFRLKSFAEKRLYQKKYNLPPEILQSVSSQFLSAVTFVNESILLTEKGFPYLNTCGRVMNTVHPQRTVQLRGVERCEGGQFHSFHRRTTTGGGTTN